MILKAFGRATALDDRKFGRYIRGILAQKQDAGPPDTAMEIKRAQTDDELAEVRGLFRAYATALGVDLGFQGFRSELAGLPGKYAPPTGDLLIGLVPGKVLGCVAVRRLDSEICEMKRLYVRPEGRGTGLGRRLAQQIIGRARFLGYASMRLDTLDRLTAAIRLYASLGFQRIDPYDDNPLPGVMYWELDLQTAAAQQAAAAVAASPRHFNACRPAGERCPCRKS